MSHENLNVEKGVVTFRKVKRQCSFLAGNGIMHKYEKEPAEIVPLEIEFKDDMLDGAVLDESSCTITVADEDGTDVTSTLLETGSKKVKSETKLRGTFKAGTVDEDYVAVFTGVTEGTAFEYIGRILIQVRTETITAAS